MNISTKAIVSNSDMIKKYRSCREKAEDIGKVFILKHNQPDAILFSIREYDRLTAILEYIESLDDQDISKAIEALPNYGKRDLYTMNQVLKDV